MHIENARIQRKEGNYSQDSYVYLDDVFLQAFCKSWQSHSKT